MRQGGKNLRVKLDDFIGAGNVENIIIRGDFNVRIGELEDRGMKERDTDRVKTRS